MNKVILFKSDGTVIVTKLLVLKNSWYIKLQLTHSGSEYAKVLNISEV